MKRHPVINSVRLVSIFLVLSSLTCCSYKLVSDEGISPMPKSSREAELIALCLWGELFPPEDFVEQVQNDLGAIRSAYGGEIQAINHITFVPPWVPGELLVGFDDATLKEVAKGKYHGNDNAWDKLNRQFEAEIDTTSLKLGGRSVKLHCKEALHPCRLTEDFYRQAFLPGIKYIQPNYLYGDSPKLYARKTGDRITYLFRNAWGDCPAGCIESEYWYFVADDGAKPVYMGYFAPQKTSPEPEWWNEAKQNIELYGEWVRCNTKAPMESETSTFSEGNHYSLICKEVINSNLIKVIHSSGVLLFSTKIIDQNQLKRFITRLRTCVSHHFPGYGGIDFNPKQKVDLDNAVISEMKLINKPLGNVHPDDPLKIVDKFVNWGYNISLSPRLIDTIIIHSSYDALGDNPYSVEGVIQEYKLYGVSPHYLIDRRGIIYRLVLEKNIAYHAGRGKMPDERININNFSIGIELIYRKDESPNETQYQSLVKLVKYLGWKYNIKTILGHSEISPERKTDPWNFDWEKFKQMVKYKIP